MKTSYKSYQIIEKIGSGGMATLYLAQDTRLNRRVALKILHPSFAGDAEYIARFEREAREAASLNHRNIVTIFDFGSEDEAYFIVMEYVDGMDLRSAIQEVPLVPMEVGLAVIEEAASALEALHLHHLVHRDIKPANILLSRDGGVKITDFGLTKRSDTTGSLSLTQPGSVIGTAYYMSPEQAVGKDVDPRSDIFSLGVTAYEVLSGTKPFQGTSYSEVVDRVITQTPGPMTAFSPLVTPAIEALVLRMMAKEPGRRPASMQVVQQEIEACWESLPNNLRSARQRRELLRQFLADPPGFSGQLRRENLQRCLERGKYYMSLGLDRFDDAAQEFRVALRIDPQNDRATAALAELEKARDVDLLTRTVRNPEPAEQEVTARVQKSEAPATPLPAVSTPAAASAPPSDGGRSGFSWGVPVGLVVLVALAGGVVLMRATRPPDPGPAPKSQVARPAAPAPSTPGPGTLSAPEQGTRSPAATTAPPPVSALSESVAPAPPAPVVPTGRLAVTTTPAGATVNLRWAGAGTAEGGGRYPAPLAPRDLRAGAWSLRVALKGYVPRDTTLVVDAGRSNRVAFLLQAEAPARPPAPTPTAPTPTAPTSTPNPPPTPTRRPPAVGYTVLRVSVFPPAQLFLDNSLYQKDPDKVFYVRATPGASHTIEVRTGDNRTHRWDNLTAAAGDTLRLPHFTFSK